MVRMTAATTAILRVFLEDPDQERYGLEIGRDLALPSGTVHPVLARLEGLGWLSSGWEDVDPSAASRPRRRYYRLTREGLAHARAAVRRVEERTHRLTRPATVTS